MSVTRIIFSPVKINNSTRHCIHTPALPKVGIIHIFLPSMLNWLLYCRNVIESIRTKLSLRCHPPAIVLTLDFLHTFSQDSLMSSCIDEHFTNIDLHSEQSQVT